MTCLSIDPPHGSTTDPYQILGKEERYGDGSGKDSYKAFDSYGASLEGDSGDKVIFGTDYVNNALQLKGGDGNDRIYGLGGDDTLYGGAGNDTLIGGRGVDTLNGGEDNDILEGGEANYGGTGYDTYKITSSDNGIYVEDKDGKGEIIYDGVKLTGGVLVEGSENRFIDKNTGKEYELFSDGTLVYDNSLVIGKYDINVEEGQLDILLEKTPISPETLLLEGFLQRVCVEDTAVFQAVIDGEHFENVSMTKSDNKSYYLAA